MVECGWERERVIWVFAVGVRVVLIGCCEENVWSSDVNVDVDVDVDGGD